MKNKFMRIAAVMLMLCLVTTCAISGTFAKYTTENTATDTARVAKWGITISGPTDASANNAFTATYPSHDTEGNPVYTAETVVGAADVVAPGTNGTFVTPNVTGTAEVAVRITVAASLDLKNWKVNGAEYCPIVFTVGEGASAKTFQMGDTITSVAALEEAVENEIKNYTKDYAPSAAIENIPVVTWSWAYSTSTENDAKDTALGAAAAKATTADEEITIAYSITVTATQID